MLHGVRHCFDGSAQTAARYLDLGICLGFGGAITQPGRKKLKAAALMVPASRLLVETDCPYVMPARQPGSRNEPALITHAVQALAGLRGVSSDEIASITTRNAVRLFFGGA
jgi:TatD DNase family protein